MLRIFGIAIVFLGASIAWLILGGSMGSRTTTADSRLEGAVNDLWGTSQNQLPPEMEFHWVTERNDITSETTNGKVVKKKTIVKVEHQANMPIDATNIGVGLVSKLTRKGLMWFSLYDASFAGDWSYVHHAPESGRPNHELPGRTSCGSLRRERVFIFGVHHCPSGNRRHRRKYNSLRAIESAL